MPKDLSVGFSEITPIKQYHLKDILNTHLKIVQSILSKKGNKYLNWIDPYYFYYDIYSGNGGANGISGSPIIFTELVKKYNIPHKSLFIEEDIESFNKLQDTLRKYNDDGNYKLACGDNEEILKGIINIPPLKKQYGLLYADNNGCPNYETIIDFFQIKQYEKLDVLINLPATAHKRSLKVEHCKISENLAQIILKIDKDYWIIREPYGKWQWTFLIGTNWNAFPAFEHLGFCRCTTDKGREILKKITYTASELKEIEQNGYYRNYSEYLNHPFFKLIRKESMARGRDKFSKIPICEKCKKSHASEPHHLKYPKMPTFEDDTPEKIIVVCHKCHAKLHGKET